MKKIFVLLLITLLNGEVLFNKGWHLKGGVDLNLSLFSNYNILIWKYENKQWKYFSNKINLKNYPKIKNISKNEGFWIKVPCKIILKKDEILSSPYIKYKNLLNHTFLQLVNSNHIITNKQFFNENFYLSNNRYLTFYMCGKYKRSELRFLDEFTLDSNKNLKAYVRLKDINSSKYTCLQIFNKTKDKPLVRIAYYKKIINGIPNKIWAVINEKYFLLTSLKKFNITLKIKNYNLKIFINNTLKVDYNFSENSINYFKLGIYLQDNGCSKSYFKDIEFK